MFFLTKIIFEKNIFEKIKNWKKIFLKKLKIEKHIFKKNKNWKKVKN